MKWDESYATGVKEIDDQHKMLFETTEVYRDVLAEGDGKTSYPGFLEFLAAYVEIHFAVEEECMLAHKCPFAGKNKAEHKQFMVAVRNEETAFQELGFEIGRVLKLLDLIENWLDSHIRRIDVHLNDCVN
ncbi:MAG: hypothetical protein COC12_07390 [Rhodobacteraceae bacterium]|nr:MAG: hypothetical protein COC12_07390 [Paracoccaceae bacterium]